MRTVSNKLPLAALFGSFLLLCASAAYWGLQLFKPPVRPVAAPLQVRADAPLDMAIALFGGRSGPVAVASNYQLKGVVVSARASESIAILAVEGKPAEAVRVDKELQPGVVVKEVHPHYVVLSENGVSKRVELPESAKVAGGVSTVSPVNANSGAAMGNGFARGTAPDIAPGMPPVMPPAQESPQQAQPPANVPTAVPPQIVVPSPAMGIGAQHIPQPVQPGSVNRP